MEIIQQKYIVKVFSTKSNFIHLKSIRQGIVKKALYYVHCSASNYINNFGYMDVEILSSPQFFVDSKKLNNNYDVW